MWASDGARVDALRDKVFRLCGTSRWSTDQLREALQNSSNDVNKAADALAAKVPKMPETDSEPPSTPPGLRTPAKPSFIMPDTVALTPAQVVAAPPVAPVVRVGVGVVVRDPSDGKILVGERYGSHGADKLAFPGGHLEMNESWEECARREVYEETGLQLGPITHAATTNDPMPAEGKHYITIFMQADARAGQTPVNLEPHKCKGWIWMSWKEIVALPADRMFIPFQHFVEIKAAEEEAKQAAEAKAEAEAEAVAVAMAVATAEAKEAAVATAAADSMAARAIEGALAAEGVVDVAKADPEVMAKVTTETVEVAEAEVAVEAGGAAPAAGGKKKKKKGKP